MRLILTFFLLALSVSSAYTQSPAKDTVYGDLTADQAAFHALSRLSFGARPGEAEKIRRQGISAWINQQLEPESIDDSYVDSLIATLRYASMSTTEATQHNEQYRINQRALGILRARYNSDTFIKKTTKEQDDAIIARATSRDTLILGRALSLRTDVLVEIQTARFLRAVYSERQLLEVMTEFWLNHFSVFYGKSANQIYQLTDYERIIRKHALGDFRALLGAVAKSPAMLIYLDNAASQANGDAPRVGKVPKRMLTNGRGLNENYGRELLELHTLGVDGGYTQQDVIDVARSLTGWTIKSPAEGGGFIFRPAIHDAGTKKVLGHVLPAGRGIEDGEQVLDILALHPSTAKFIAAKLARRFISDTPSVNLIDRAAKVFISSKGDIKAIVREIVTSEEFFSQAVFRTKVKTPFELVASTARTIGAPPDTSRSIVRLIANLGQPVFGKRTPNGWPDTGTEWINTGSILSRINFGMAVINNRFPGAKLSSLSWVTDIQRVPLEEQVDAVIQHILGGYASVDTRSVLMRGENPLALKDSSSGSNQNASASSDSMMRADRDSDAKSSGQRNRNPRKSRPSQNPTLTMIGLALGSPEFQRR